jgi:hypothetical protein
LYILDQDPCKTNPCTHGHCIPDGGSYTCICHSGYSGSACDGMLPSDINCKKQLYIIDKICSSRSIIYDTWYVNVKLGQNTTIAFIRGEHRKILIRGKTTSRGLNNFMFTKYEGNNSTNRRMTCLRRVWRYQRGNQNRYIEEEQTKYCHFKSIWISITDAFSKWFHSRIISCSPMILNLLFQLIFDKTN